MPIVRQENHIVMQENTEDMSRCEVSVIRADAKDTSCVIGLFREIEAEEEPNHPEAQELAEKEFNQSLMYFNFLQSDSFWVLLGQRDGKTVGYATVVRIPKVDARLGVLYVDEVYVLKPYRRKEVGTALFQEIYRMAQAFGYWRIRLNADPADPIVRSFYESLGFKDSGNGFFEKKVEHK